jgi:hypothetical protein
MYLNKTVALTLLGYGMFVGYEVHKHEVDKKIGRILGHTYDELSRRTAVIMLDEVDKRSNALPVKATHGTQG